MKFMGAEGQEIHRSILYINFDLSYCLYGVRMEKHSLFPAVKRHLFNRKNETRFVICFHDRNKGGFIRVKMLFENIEGHYSIPVDGKIDNLRPGRS